MKKTKKKKPKPYLRTILTNITVIHLIIVMIKIKNDKILSSINLIDTWWACTMSQTSPSRHWRYSNRGDCLCLHGLTPRREDRQQTCYQPVNATFYVLKRTLKKTKQINVVKHMNHLCLDKMNPDFIFHVFSYYYCPFLSFELFILLFWPE